MSQTFPFKMDHSLASWDLWHRANRVGQLFLSQQSISSWEFSQHCPLTCHWHQPLWGKWIQDTKNDLCNSCIHAWRRWTWIICQLWAIALHLKLFVLQFAWISCTDHHCVAYNMADQNAHISNSLPCMDTACLETVTPAFAMAQTLALFKQRLSNWACWYHQTGLCGGELSFFVLGASPQQRENYHCWRSFNTLWVMPAFSHGTYNVLEKGFPILDESKRSFYYLNFPMGILSCK